MNSFGFIITRHVNSEKTNKYWNHSVKCLRRLYPLNKIIIIDDNSNYNFVKDEFEYTNVEIIQSEFKGRGELLPYYYYLKNKCFDNAVIIHDSVFIHRRINFDIFKGILVMPIWHFNADNENIENTRKLIQVLSNSTIIENKLKNEFQMGLFNKWYGCFGTQTYINHNFLLHIERKYKITKLLSNILCRADRCSIERIMGCIFSTEYPQILKMKSLLGDITKCAGFCKYTFDNYNNLLTKGFISKAVVKVWTGR
jgi:hypothetical protein